MNARQRLGHLAGEVVLTMLALGGLVCIALVGLAFFFDITLIMFKTGSMSPTIPAGSVAVVREIPASEIEIGDVVTVDRVGALPVTHRVTSVAAGPSGHERVITMRGDANETDDPAPYVVSSVRIVLGSVPGLANVIVWFSHPLVLGGITVGASALVTWAFWPREPRVPPMVRRRGRHAFGAGASLVLAVGIAMPLALAAPAPASAAEQVVHGNYLTLTSITGPGMGSMEPGDTVTWQVGVAAAPPDPGEVTVSLSGTGSAGLGLTADLRVCSVRWVAGACAGDSSTLAPLDPIPVDGVVRDLLTMPSHEQRWLLVSVTMPASASPALGDAVTLLVHAAGHGDTVVVGPGTLTPTGLNPDLPLQLGLLAVGGGLAVALVARRRREVRP